MKQYILALDEGTTSARSILFDRAGRTAAVAQKEIGQSYPQDGWVGQDAEEIWNAQRQTMEECVKKAGISPEEIAAIGITNQRETTVLWEKSTGKPVADAIVWQCRRTAPICEELTARGYEELIRNRTGLKPDAYFSGTKMKWLLDNIPGARERAERGELLFGTVDSYLVYRLTEGRVHVTDATNASRTMLCNIRTCEWDETLLSLLGIPRAALPEIRSSAEVYGTTTLFGAQIPITGMAGDQQAALFGQGCFTPGSAKNTYGTGCFLLMHTGNEPRHSSSGLLTTVAATEKGKPHEYALEGSVFVAGALIQWLRDGLGLMKTAAESEELALRVPDTGGVYLVPAFTGLGAPYWDMYARGTIVGLTRGTNRSHIVRAGLEAIALQVCDVLDAIQKDTGMKVSRMFADGGASANRLLMQMQADFADVCVEVAADREATARGAAFLAGLAVGFWKDRDELVSLLGERQSYLPSLSGKERKQKREGWDRAIRRATDWARGDE